MTHTSMPGPSSRTTVMVSATIPPTIRTAAEQFLKPNYLLLSVGVVGGACSDVSQRFVLTTRQEKKGRLVAGTRPRLRGADGVDLDVDGSVKTPSAVEGWKSPSAVTLQPRACSGRS